MQGILHHSGDKLFDRFFFIKGKGVNKTWNQREIQRIDFAPKGDLQNRKQLADVASAMELLGKLDEGQIKKEFESYHKLKEQITKLQIVAG